MVSALRGRYEGKEGRREGEEKEREEREGKGRQMKEL